MSLSISQKLVAAFLGLTLLILAATLGLARWSFQQGFLDYVNALEQQRLETLRDQVAAEYVEAGNSWSTLTNRLFQDLQRRFAPLSIQPPPPPRREERGERREEGNRKGKNRAKDKGRDMGPPPRGDPGGQSRQALPTTALYDNAGTLIAGSYVDSALPDTISVPVFANGETIGALLSEPRRALDSPLETAFSQKQLRTSWLIGTVSLFAALLLSMLLARGLLAPVRRMMNSVSVLSSGDYSTRLDEQRGDELGQLTRDLDRLARTLEESQSARQRLFADIAHELRTPLTVLSGEIEALKDGIRSFDLEQLHSLDQEVQRLRLLIDDLYQLSLADVGGLRYQFAPLSLNECIRDSLEGSRERFAAQGLELEVETGSDAIVQADEQRIDQLLRNLFENALKYTDVPGHVRIVLGSNGDSAQLLIEDSAPGVPAQDCERLFDPLYRRDGSRSRSSGGAGLGLAICRSIVEAHGGTIMAAPSALGGLAVEVRLPLEGPRPS